MHTPVLDRTYHRPWEQPPSQGHQLPSFHTVFMNGTTSKSPSTTPNFHNPHTLLVPTLQNTIIPQHPRSYLQDAGPSLPVPRAQPPPPADDDDDFPPVNKLSQHSYHPASRVAGVRHSSPYRKRKGETTESEPSSSRKGMKRKATTILKEDIPAGKKQKGRLVGCSNYSDDDLNFLLDTLAVDQPLGGKGWNKVTDTFNKWANGANRPQRTARSLESKFKLLVRTRKPTGSGVIPPHVARAFEIEELMNKKAASRDLDDEDIVDETNDYISIDNSDEDTGVTARVKVKEEPVEGSLIARRVPNSTLSSRRPRNFGADVLNTLTSALDPATQRARDEANSSRSFQTAQFLSLNTRIRDLERVNENLHERLRVAERELSDAQRRADRAEIRLEFGTSPQLPILPTPSTNGPRRSSRISARQSTKPSDVEEDVVVHELAYRNGGNCRQVFRGNELDDFNNQAIMRGDFDGIDTRRYCIEDTTQQPDNNMLDSGLDNDDDKKDLDYPSSVEC